MAAKWLFEKPPLPFVYTHWQVTQNPGQKCKSPGSGGGENDKPQPCLWWIWSQIRWFILEHLIYPSLILEIKSVVVSEDLTESCSVFVGSSMPEMGSILSSNNTASAFFFFPQQLGMFVIQKIRSISVCHKRTTALWIFNPITWINISNMHFCKQTQTCWNFTFLKVATVSFF